MIFFGSVIAIIVGFVFMLVAKGTMDHSRAFPKDRTVGVWSWTAPDSETTAQKAAHADSLKKLGITDVYIDISSYIDHAELPDLQARKQQVGSFTQSLREEASTLTSRGIRPHAVAGNTRWANPDSAYIPLKVQQYISTYNQESSPHERMASLQFDIEFYSDKNFSDAPLQNTEEYLALVDRLVAAHQQLFINGGQIPLGFAVPTWFDGNNQDMPKLPRPIGAQLMDKLQGIPDSYIVIMDYRKQTDGEDGSIAKAKTLFDMAQSGHSPVKLLIGQETVDVQPKKITFYGSSQNELVNATTTLNEAFSAYPQFTGFVINDEAGLLQLTR
jgi:hypothetical protein